jgi:membrane protein
MANAPSITAPRSARTREAVALVAWKRCQRNGCSGVAAQAAYHILFAIFPLAIFAAALSAIVNAAFGLDLFDAIMAALTSVLPAEARAAIAGPVAAVVNHRSGRLLILGIVTALWSGATAVGTFITALNRAYDCEETRPWWRRKGLEVVLTLSLGTAVVVAFILIVFGGKLGAVIAAHVGLGTPFRVAWAIGRWPAIAGMIMAALAVFYGIGPNVVRPFRWLSAGAILGTLVWILAMGGFGLYVGEFGQYDRTYGTLGGVIILLLVFYISSLIIILGGELNGALDRRHDAGAAEQSPATTGGGRDHPGREHRSGRAQIHTPKTTGERAADAVAIAMGSWRFIIVQSAIVAAWIGLNLVAVLRHFDPYPFILLNLLFSTQAAYAAPIIMMSQNRQATKDRRRDDHEAVTVDATAEIVALIHANTEEIHRLAREQAAILAAQDRVLAQQTELLTLLRGHIARPEEDSPPG